MITLSGAEAAELLSAASRAFTVKVYAVAGESCPTVAEVVVTVCTSAAPW